MATQLPPRPDAREEPRERRWLPALAVLAVIIAVAGCAGWLADGSHPDPVRASGIDGIVRVTPSPGWGEAARSDEGTTHQVVLRSGTAGLAIVGIEGFDADAGALALHYVEHVLRPGFLLLAVGRHTGVPRRASESSRVEFSYVGVTRAHVTVEGVVTATVATTGDGVVFDGFVPEGDLPSALGDISSMITEAEIA
jgi:hypothetical protein